MRILFDLVHPADALFFYHAIRRLEADGATILIASRRKDVLMQLLDEMGFAHQVLTTASRGLVGQAHELVLRDAAMIRLARKWEPDVMVGFGGVAISHAGKLLGTPSISFYDTEHAALQLRLTLPFVSEWHVPHSWTGPTASGRTFRFTGSKQFAYLHPDYFRANPHVAEAAGWDPARDNFMIRTVAWQANHDRGRGGIPERQLRRIVDELSRRGKVHISAEGPLPADLEPLRTQGTPWSFHHLLAHCRLYCGESITVASEAAALGVPVLLQIDKEYAYVAEQERAGLIRRFAPGDDVGAVVRAALSEPKEAYRFRAERFAQMGGDLNQYIANAITQAARPAEWKRKSA
jgi:uncharacterized protein